MAFSQFHNNTKAGSNLDAGVHDPNTQGTSNAWIMNDDFVQWLEQTISVISSRDPSTTAKNSFSSLSTEGKRLSLSSSRYSSAHTTAASHSSAQTGLFQFEKQSSKLQKALQVAGCFCALMNSWGFLNSYGVFQAYYASNLKPAPSASQLGWIGSIQSFLLLFVSVIVGPALDSGCVRYIMATGTVLFALGLIATSFSTQYYQLVLSQGIVTGLAAGCFYLPGIAIPPLHFGPKHRTTILGIVAAGSGVGGIVFPVMVKKLLPRVGFGWTVRAIAFATVPLNIFATLVLRTNTCPEQKRKLFDVRMFKEPKYVILCASAFFGFGALYIPIFFIEEYALQQTNISSDLASYLVPIVMAGSLFGRTLPNMLAEKLQRPLLVLIATTGLASLLCFVWIALKSAQASGIVVFSVLYGFVSGGYVSLIPPVVVALAPDLEKIGTRFGMLLEWAAFGALAGNPLAGAILSGTQSYVELQCFTGVALMLTVLLQLRIWIPDRKH